MLLNMGSGINQKLCLMKDLIDNIIFIEGEGYFKEVTINRYNKYGINEPYTIYEPIELNYV